MPLYAGKGQGYLVSPLPRLDSFSCQMSFAFPRRLPKKRTEKNKLDNAKTFWKGANLKENQILSKSTI